MTIRGVERTASGTERAGRWNAWRSLPLTVMGLVAIAATASAHTVQICWKDDGAVTTFYAGTYHSPSEGPSPVGDIIIDGFNYPFSGYILPAALPADVQCFACTASTPGSLGTPPSVVHYQTFTSGFALASHSISFDTSTVVQSPWCSFPAQTFGGGTCADADFDGLCNDVDPCPLDAENDGDGDGLCADVDNCPLVANADQTDANGNGQGDACEGVICGNGLLTPPEECDDGNIAGGDGCSAICTIEGTCGNGTAESGEACDDGNTSNGDCCSADCQTATALNTPCELDADLCTIDACNGTGSCAFVSNVTCQAANPPCEGGEVCNPGTGSCDPQPDADSSTTCEADSNLCTNDHCDGSGSCVLLSNVTCQAANPPCEAGEVCNPGTGNCDAQPDADTSTTCEADGDLCTNDHCDGSGSCVLLSNVTCQAANPPCEGGAVCNTSTGNCDPLPDAPSSTTCEADASLCTHDHCDGSGSCVLLSTVTCTALDQCHVVGTCSPGTGICSNPNKVDGQVCDDGDVCTQTDQCIGGVCTGNNTGADTDDDGYCDLFETQVDCDPLDQQEIPPQAATYAGSGAGPANVLVTESGPAGPRVLVATDPSCATTGVCGPPPPGFSDGFCTAGRIADRCTVNNDCNLPTGTCRLVVNYADVPDLVLEYAVLNRITQPIAGFTPVHPGCSRKVDVQLDTTRRSNRVKIRMKGTVFGRGSKDKDTFRYR